MDIRYAFVSKSAVRNFLSSLYFPEHRLRQDAGALNLTESHSFSWIYGHQDHHCTTVPVWLQDPGRVYWIKGKPGSGKSTMMKRIVETEVVEHIASRTPHVRALSASFFIWKPATVPLQKTVEGMLRSLLYQIFDRDQYRQLILPFIHRHRAEENYIPVWTEATLKGVLLSVLAAAEAYPYRLCLFIDGLDEIAQGSWSHLRSLLGDIHRSGSVWLCVSSRPEFAVPACKVRYCDLNMAMWNWLDMYNHAAAKLGPYNVSSDVFRRIADVADGIFLWARLVTRNILDSLENLGEAVDVEDILLTLSRFRGLDELFEELLRRASGLRGKRLRYYLRVMTLQQDGFLDPSHIALLTMARLSGDMPRYNEFVLECQKTELQVVAQSSGLLNVQIQREVLPGEVWVNCHSASIIYNEPDSQASAPIDRRLVRVNWHVKQVCQYWGAKLEWLHRSVHEYITEHSHDAIFSFGDMMSDRDIVEGLLRGRLHLLTHGPASSYNRAYTARYSLSNLRGATGQTYQIIAAVKRASEITEMDSWLERLRERLSTLSPREFSREELVDTIAHPKGPQQITRHEALPTAMNAMLPFWCGCVYEKCYDYIQACQKRSQTSVGSPWMFATLVLNCCFTNVTLSLIDHEPAPLPDDDACFFIMNMLQGFRATYAFPSSETQKLFSSTIEDVRRTGASCTGITFISRPEASGSDFSSIELLAAAWLCWNTRLQGSHTHARQQVEERLSKHAAEVTRYFAQILDDLQVRISTRSWKRRNYPRRIEIQASAAGFPQTQLRRILCSTSTSEFAEYWKSQRVQFRLVCRTDRRRPFRRGHRECQPTFEAWEIPVAFSARVVGRDGQKGSNNDATLEDQADTELDELLVDAEFRHELIKAVLEDEEDQLNAWGRLIVSACIRNERYHDWNDLVNPEVKVEIYRERLHAKARDAMDRRLLSRKGLDSAHGSQTKRRYYVPKNSVEYILALRLTQSFRATARLQFFVKFASHPRSQEAKSCCMCGKLKELG